MTAYDPLDVRYYTVPEVAKMLRLSKMTVYRAVRSEELESITIGTIVRIPEPALRAWLREPQEPR